MRETTLLKGKQLCIALYFVFRLRSFRYTSVNELEICSHRTSLTMFLSIPFAQYFFLKYERRYGSKQ